MTTPISRKPIASDAAPWLPVAERPRKANSRRRSFHLAMRDGVRLAVDVHLPDVGQQHRADHGRLPTILRQTRYFRSHAFRPPFGRLPLEWMLNSSAPTRERFLANGYAWVDVCTRGSGASFGQRPCPWSPDEVADGGEVVEWIVQQPWSNGRVGSTGISYDGTTAEMLLVNNHPAVKAVIPRFSLYDVFPDVAFPGGIHLAWFTEQWGHFNAALDSNALDVAFSKMIRLQAKAMRGMLANERPSPTRWLASALDSSVGERVAKQALRLVASGVRPVDHEGASALEAAVNAHAANFNVHEGALDVDFRDDAGMAPGYPDASVDMFSPHAHAAQLRASGAAVYSYSGWLDGAYQNSACKRFRALGNAGSRLILGPWDHGGHQNISPFSPSTASAFDHEGEMLRFFDLHLLQRDNSLLDEPTVRYFTIGEERWKSAPTWPPPEAIPRRWYLSEQRGLARTASNHNGHDDYRVDRDVGSGMRSRWNSLLGLLAPVGYNDRRELGDRLLTYRSEPLAHDCEISGHPEVELWLACDNADPQVFAYLELETPDGHVHCVSEGQIRAVHRQLQNDPHQLADPQGPACEQRSYRRTDAQPLVPGELSLLHFSLLPVSWRAPAGARWRLAIAGADCDHFALPSPSTLSLAWGSGHPSALILPEVDPQ